MFGGNGGDLSKVMEQMGVDMDELDAERITIELEDGGEIVFTNTTINRLNAQGNTMYQIVGEPDEESEAQESDSDEEGPTSVDPTFTDEDVSLVAKRAQVSEERAREALDEAEGDLAEAIDRL